MTTSYWQWAHGSTGSRQAPALACLTASTWPPAPAFLAFVRPGRARFSPCTRAGPTRMAAPAARRRQGAQAPPAQSTRTCGGHEDGTVLVAGSARRPDVLTSVHGGTFGTGRLPPRSPWWKGGD